MRPSQVKALWNQGKPAMCTAVTLNDPSVVELVSLLGFHCIWLDFEHHLHSLESAGHLMRAARVGGADVMARPAKGEFARLSRLLEAGANGILYPRCESREEAREVIRWAKFAPLGERGFDGGNPDMPYGLMDMATYVAQANAQTFVLCQIESPSAVEHARAIAEVEGVDGLFFGPGDYSVLSGRPGQVNSPELWSAMERVCKDARAAGKHFGTLAFDEAGIRRVLDLGGTFVSCSADVPLLRDGFLALRRQFERLGFAVNSPYGQQKSAYAGGQAR